MLLEAPRLPTGRPPRTTNDILYHVARFHIYSEYGWTDCAEGHVLVLESVDEEYD